MYPTIVLPRQPHPSPYTSLRLPHDIIKIFLLCRLWCFHFRYWHEISIDFYKLCKLLDITESLEFFSLIQRVMNEEWGRVVGGWGSGGVRWDVAITVAHIDPEVVVPDQPDSHLSAATPSCLCSLSVLGGCCCYQPHIVCIIIFIQYYILLSLDEYWPEQNI